MTPVGITLSSLLNKIYKPQAKFSMFPGAFPWLAIDSHPQWEFQRCSLVVVDDFFRNSHWSPGISYVIAAWEDLPKTM